MRVSGTLPPDTSARYSGNSLNRKVEAYNDAQALMSGVSNAERSTLNTRRSGEGDISEVHGNAFLVSSEFNKNDVGGNCQTCESNDIKAGNVEKLPADGMSNCETSLASFMGNGQDMVSPSASIGFVEFSKSHCDLNIDKVIGHNSDRDVHGLCSGLSSISIHSRLEDTGLTPASDGILFTNNSYDSSGRQYLLQDNQHSDKHSTWSALWEDRIVEDLLNLDYGKPKCCKSNNNISPGISSPGLPLNLEQSSHQLWQQDKICHQNLPHKPSDYFDEPLETVFGEHVESNEKAAGFDDKFSPDMAESSIISNILSLELDTWEDSLVKLLGESDEQCSSFKAPTLRKVQDKNQSRFSFARQEFLNEASDLEQSFGVTGHAPCKYFASRGLVGNKDTLSGKDREVLPSSSSGHNFVGSQSFVPSNFSGECWLIM